MTRRRVLITAALVVSVILLILFIVVGIPFIQATFSTPIPGLPTANPVSSPNSLRDRYTQTAQARQSQAAPGTTATAPATPP